MRIVDRRPWPERWLAELDARPDRLTARMLAPASALWAVGAGLRRRFLRARPLPATPSSLGVGNVRVGGTGKTPVVEDLGRRLAAEGHRVAVLTRGYRSAGAGDEPEWLEAAGLRVYVDPDRHRAFDRARADGADRVLLDDGLQTRHRPRWRIAIVLDRDLARAPRPLPAGPAREGGAGLRAADAVLVRREAPGATPFPLPALGFRLAPAGFVDVDGHEVEAPAAAGVLFSGLARPESFEADATACGLRLQGSWRESDHWSPGEGDRRRLRAFADELGASWVLAPEKNLQRLAGLGLGLPVVGLRSRIEWDDRTDPLQWLRDCGVGI